MIYRFDDHGGLIVIFTEVFGPSGSVVARLALDTGATGTTINQALLVAIGYDPAVAEDRIEVTTGSGLEYVPRFPVDRLVALGRQRDSFPVLAHTLPPSASVDGLLGLDFFRPYKLTIDFPSGKITLK
jgi:predicted aspartyl protease